MKKILFLILLSFNLIASAATSVVFLNGISGDADSTIDSSFRIATIVKNAGFGNKLNIDKTISHFYNTGDIWYSDVDEMVVQAKYSAKALNNARIATPNALVGSSQYIKHLGLVYHEGIRDKLTPGFWDDEEEAQVLSTVKNLALYINTRLSLGTKLIIVSHSQGNFYVEAVNGYLRHLKSVDEQKIYDNNLRFVSVASVAASTPANEKYMSLDEDKALKAQEARTIYISPYEVMQRNVSLCTSDILACSSILSRLDFLVHGFQKTYTSNEIDVRSGKTLADILVGFINKSFDELNIESNSAPAIPVTSTLTFVSKTSSSISLQWTVPANTTDYVLTRSGTSSNRTGSSIVDYSLLPNTTYSYSIKACNVAGCSSESNIVNITTDADALLAPTPPTLALVSKSSSSVSLQWNVPATATYFVLNRSGTVANRTGSSFVDVGLSSGTAYSYSLQACNATGCSDSSNIQSVTTDAVAVVARCTGQWTTGQYNIGQAEQQTQTCSAGYTGNVFLSHTCQAGAAGSATGIWGATNTQNNCVVAPPVTCLGAWSTTRYTVGQTEEQFSNSCPAGTQGQVRTFHTCQASGSWSANAQSDTCVAVLVAPTGLSASSVSAAQNGVAGIRLVWTAVSGATRYYITRNGSANYSSQVGTNWTDPNVAVGVQYCYTINAFSNFNNSRSAESSQVCTAYQPTQISVSPPTNVTASRYTIGGRKDILLTWTPPSPAPDSYQVFRRDRSGMLAPLGGTDTSFFDRYELNLTSGISYCYFIRSEKGGIISTESNEACSLAP